MVEDLACGGGCGSSSTMGHWGEEEEMDLEQVERVHVWFLDQSEH